MKRDLRSRAWQQATRWASLALLASVVSGSARADLGAPVTRGEAGPYQIVAFASPAPLRVGWVEWTVVVLDSESGERAEGVALFAELTTSTGAEHDHHMGGLDGTLPSRSQGVVAGRVEMRTPGPWSLHVRIVPDAEGLPHVHRRYAVEVEPAVSQWREVTLALIVPYAALWVAYLQTAARGRRRR